MYFEVMSHLKKIKMLYIYYFLTAVAVAIIIFICSTFKADRVQVDQEGVNSLNNGWVLVRDDGSRQDITLPAIVKSGVEKNKTSSIQNTLPMDLKDGMTLSFATYHATVQVFVENNLIYQFGLDNHYLFGKSPACTAWHFVDLPASSQGKQITMKFCSPYEKYSGIFNSITIGRKSADIADMVHNLLPSTMIDLLLLIFGMILMLMYLIARKRMRQNTSLLYQALFTVGVSISALCETSMLQLVSGNVFIIGYIMYFSLMLCPIPYLLFVKTVYAKRHHAELYDFLCVLAVINFIICTFLQVTNLLDFYETVTATHIVILAGLFLSLYTAFENLCRYHDRTIRAFLFGSTVMLFFFLIDLIRYHLGIYKDGALLCRMGLLVFITIPTIDAISHSFSMIELGMESRFLERLAYIDPLTQKRNRTSFEKEMDGINASKKINDTAIVTFDLNNLKPINDTFGHKSGDDLIIGAANAIQASFGAFGHCFRIGGDEFVVILRDCNKERLITCLDSFEKHIRNYNYNNRNKLEIAYGCAKYEPDDDDIFETLNRADERMYKLKRQMKANNSKISDK
jgi:diguanylate cyclase